DLCRSQLSIRYYVPLSSHAKRQLIRSVASPYLREISSVNPHAAALAHKRWMAPFGYAQVWCGV
ncbi:MAG: hypothetical protein ACK5PB_10790, partial [Pirellula sp.]